MREKLQRLFKKEKADTMPSEPGVIYAPVAGKVIPLKEIADGVFSEKVLGPGCGIVPVEELVCAPFSGTIIQVADTKHAIGIRSKDGMEWLIHVGIDTVEMNGDGFTTYVKINDVVNKGQKLMEFSLEKIQQAGYVPTTAIILCNANEIGEPSDVKTEMVQVGDVLMEVDI